MLNVKPGLRTLIHAGFLCHVNVNECILCFVFHSKNNANLTTPFAQKSICIRVELFYVLILQVGR